MNKFFPALLVVFPVICLAAEAPPDLPPKPQDFAYAIPLQVDGQGALYQTPLPKEVYQNTVRNDLGDLRVFNAADEVVPYTLQQPASAITEKSQNIKLSFFPLTTTANEGLDQISVRMRRNASGMLLSVDTGNHPAGKGKVSGYLLDVSAIKPSIQSLALDWKNAGDSFTGTLNVESSNDLKHWQSIVRDAPIASLQHDGHRLEQKQISFSPVNSKYLRLSWPAEQTTLQLNDITAELAPQTSETPFNWSSANGAAVTQHPGEYQFDLGAHLPIQRLRFSLPQINTLVDATLFSRDKEADKWQQVSQATLYHLLQNGKEFSNADLRIYSNHRYWLVKVELKNGGLGSGTPNLLAGWQAQLLQFVARGTPPFRIVYGSSQVKPATFRIQSVLAENEKADGAVEIRNAITGTPQEMGSLSNLSPPPAPLPWKKWLLWGSLVVAVLVLGWMARSLMQQMDKPKS